MLSWGGLNPALTAWRNAINRRLPGRDTRTDGARADRNHGSTSQHQEDGDGTVDAFDMDKNVLKSSTPTGTAAEKRIVEALKLDFEQDPHRRSQLWISDREIANADVGDWRERPYGGDSPHTEHVHWESRQSREHIGADWPMPNTDRLLAELNGEDTMTKAEFLALLKDKDVRAALASAVLTVDGIIVAPPGSKNTDGSANTHWTAASYFQWGYRHAADASAFADAAVKAIGALPSKLPVGTVVDETTLTRAFIAALRELTRPAT